MKKIRIALVEDHKFVREMLSKMMSDNTDIEIVGESGEFDEAIAMIKTERPDVVLLDINLLKASGMDAVPLIRKYSPGTKIIAVSMHQQSIYAKKMLQLGARGYVTKSSSCEEIINSIHEVMNGNIYICTEIKDMISAEKLNDAKPGANTRDLSFREIEIIKLIKEGGSSNEIAAHLHISASTVEVHRHNIFKKLKLKNTASLVNYINNTDLFC